MPLSDGSSEEIYQLEISFNNYQVVFFGGALNGNAEINLFGDQLALIGVIRFFNDLKPLPPDQYAGRIIYMHVQMSTLDAIIHELESATQRLIIFDSAVPLAMLRFG
jgi:hypothetical protein